MLELIRNIFSLTFKNFTTLPMRYSLKKKEFSLSLSLDNYQKLNPIRSYPRLSISEI